MSREKALFTTIDRLRNATIIAESMVSTRVTAETAKKKRAIKRRSPGWNYLKTPKSLRHSQCKRMTSPHDTTTHAAAEVSLRQNGIHETHLVLLLHSDLGLFQAK